MCINLIKEMKKPFIKLITCYQSGLAELGREIRDLMEIKSVILNAERSVLEVVL